MPGAVAGSGHGCGETSGTERRALVYAGAHREGHGGGILYALAVAHVLSHSHRTRILFPRDLDRDELARLYPVSLDGLEIEMGVPPTSVREEVEALVRSPHDVTVIHGTAIPRLPGRGRVVLVTDFPLQESLVRLDRARVRRYRVVANSEFTARWVRRRWGVDAPVLHPPVFPVEPREKRPWILAVGRFAGRRKRQLEIVEMFRRLVEQGRAEGWTLHLAGSRIGKAYSRTVVEAARGLPVEIHFDASREELEALFGHASLYWHAVGLGVDLEEEPEKAEHFGISTVEAMSAGAVPVVIRAGGQIEILGDPPAGVPWETAEECVERTAGLIADPDRREELGERARERSRSFWFERFVERAPAALGLTDPYAEEGP